MYTVAMKPSNPSLTTPPDPALQALEADLGEPVLYRASARFLGSQGLGAVPLDLWGLVVLTPGRLVYRRFAQVHPLSGGRSEEVRWEVARDRFDACTLRRQGFWARWSSGVPDHVHLSGSGASLALEVADDLDRLPSAWATTAP